ncbi:MAG: sensor histidine kinase, partial [Peptostreptococcaceae bacterium]
DVFNKKKEHTPEDYEKLIKVIENNNDRLSKLVEELLSISNKDNIDFKDNIKFNKIIKNVVCELNELAQTQNISIYIEDINNYIGNDCYGNEQLLYRAIFNLVENSIKYNNENGYVKINLYQENNFINITIEDNGYGIRKEDYENIFEPFYRVDKSRSRKIGGSGLGLYIVKTIVEQHKGHIYVKSSDNGSQFKIQIPHN